MPADHERPVSVFDVSADIHSDRLYGRACIWCGSRSGPLTYVGWARMTGLFAKGYISCPVNACAACRASPPAP
ncbi:hypothetical protein [Streptomyces axinellae]|uniref:Uncharacterized protein n=1 Tax=Streptomyces axinellae TaxID=552788 RepID=A0ABN3PXY4_9ACTN